MPGPPKSVSLKARRGQTMPQCSFGAACSRKDCIYSHAAKPPPASSAAAATAPSPVCVPFLLGKCSFGSRCRNLHPAADEAERLLRKARATPCRFGPQCRTQDCIYAHAAPPAEALAPGTRSVRGDVVGVTTIRGAAVVEQPPEALRFPQSTQPRLADPRLVQFPASAALQARREAELPAAGAAQPSSVRIPSDVWVSDWKRNPGVFHLVPDPWARFAAVNASSPRGVLDLHFQTTDRAVEVLAAALARQPGLADWEYYDPLARAVWVVTGAGNHTLQKGRTLLFDVVLEWLQASGLKFSVAKDNYGQAGAFLVEGVP